MSASDAKEIAETLRELAERFVEDRREPDKLLCHVSSLRRAALDIERGAEAGEEPDDGLRFQVTLLRVASGFISGEALAALDANCTHVTGLYWIMEGDTDYLRAEDVRFAEIGIGAVPGLGGRTEDELCEICEKVFGVDVRN